MPASPTPPNESESSGTFPPPEGDPPAKGPPLLFDENLAPRLADLLGDVYPASSSLRAEGLEGAEDGRVWSYAATHGYLLVTKDEDFQRLSILNGWPPKVVWIRLGNCLTTDIAGLLRRSVPLLIELADDDQTGVLYLG